MIHPLSHYFTYHLTKETREVYWHAFFFNLALAMAYIFEPIFLFRIGFSLTKILFFYGLVYIYYVLFIFLGAKAASKFGYKRSIFVASVFYVVYWIALYQLRQYDGLFYVVPALFALQKSFFWPAYDAEVAISSVKQQRGRELGFLFSLVGVAAIVGPFLGGWLLSDYGFKALFFTTSILIITSVYPLFRTPEVYGKHTFTFRNFVKVFTRYKQNFFGYFGMAEDLMMATVWPVVIFMTVSGVFGVGLITTFASLIATVLMLYVGKLLDKLHKKDVVQFSALVYGITWIFRFLASKTFSILAFDALGRTGKGMMNLSMVALTFDIAGSKDADWAIAYGVFYEFSLSIAKIFTVLGSIFILEIGGSLAWVFVFTGILTMFYGLLKK